MRTKSSEYAALHAPSCIGEFEHSVIPLGNGASDQIAEFTLKCKECGADQFEVFGFPLAAPDPSPYSGLAPGDIFFRPPHRLKCVTCGRTAPIFDARTQGYDGVLNGGCTYESGENGEEAAQGVSRIIISFCYNAELSELQELAEESGVDASDLFDAIAILGADVTDDHKFSLDYECA